MQANIEKERDELIREVNKDSTAAETSNDATGGLEHQQHGEEGKPKRRKRRWDTSGPSTTQTEATDPTVVSDSDSVRTSNVKSNWDEDTSDSGSGRRRKRWDETPVVISNATDPILASGNVISTPAIKSSSKWDDTPVTLSGIGVQETPSTTTIKSNRWAETPAPIFSGSSTQTPAHGMVAGNLSKALSLEREMESRNRPWTDAALDAILPTEGYIIIRPPSSYVPLRTPGRKLLATPTPMSMTQQGFQMEIPVEQRQDASVQDIREAYGVPLAITSSETGDASALPYIKPEDMQYFGRLMEDTNEEKLTKEETNERRIMSLLLKIKNGTPPQRKTAMRQITDRARNFGAGPLFNQILPLLMSPTLEDQERHLLVKVIDRVLYKLDDLVRPFVHRILAVIEPLLIDEDYYARVEGREIISNLAKAAGLATMIATMRPDIDSPDEYVRNTTSRAVAVVASALGVPALLPFLKAVCQSRKSWQARHTGIKIVQQIALLMGVALLP